MQADHFWSAVKDGSSIETAAELYGVNVEQVRAVLVYGRRTL